MGTELESLNHELDCLRNEYQVRVSWRGTVESVALPGCRDQKHLGRAPFILRLVPYHEGDTPGPRQNMAAIMV